MNMKDFVKMSSSLANEHHYCDRIKPADLSLECHFTFRLLRCFLIWLRSRLDFTLINYTDKCSTIICCLPSWQIDQKLNQSHFENKSKTKCNRKVLVIPSNSLLNKTHSLSWSMESFVAWLLAAVKMCLMLDLSVDIIRNARPSGLW